MTLVFRLYCCFLVFLFGPIAYSQTSSDKALHLIERFTYGPKPGEVEGLGKTGESGLKQWFEKQLLAKNNTESQIKSKLSSFALLSYDNEQMIKSYPQKNMVKKMKMDVSEIEGGPQDIIKAMVFQKLVRAIESDNQLEEVMVDFWFNHFNVFFDKAMVRNSITSFERDAIRGHVFGNFKDMLLAVAKSPAMLIYLDNASSRKGKINENYARELLELHTLGVDGGYTQKDIQEAARVLTGWGVEKPRQILEFKFSKAQHDNGPKKVLGLIFKGNEGIGEGEKLISYLTQHKSTAKFIAKKLAVKFINDNPRPETVELIAKVFLDTQGDLKKVYHAIIDAPEFWESKTMRSKIKTPLEFFVSAVRASKSEFLIEEKKLGQLRQFFDQSGQALYRCQVPTGYKAVNEAWVSPGALVYRVNMAFHLMQEKLPQVKAENYKVDLKIHQEKAKTQMEILNRMNQLFFDNKIKKITLEKIDGLYTEFEEYKINKNELLIHYAPVEKLMAVMLSSPEFQRR